MTNTYLSRLLVGIFFYLTLPTCLFAKEVESQISKSNVLSHQHIKMKDLSEILDEFTRYAEKVKNDWKIPGMSIAIVQGHNIIYTKGFGERNTNHDPVTPETIFNIASLTKSFTATLLAIQIAEGKYRWNTKIVDLYPNFKMYDDKTTKQFEVADLVAHQSGLPEQALNELFNFGYSANHMIYALRYVKPIIPFRSSFAYQNIPLLIAQKIIEKESGQSYAEILDEKIFSPLGMKHANVLNNVALTQLNDVAQPNVYYQGTNYPYDPSRYQSVNLIIGKKHDNVGAASGGINASAQDLSKWLMFNINNGYINDTQILNEKTMNVIHASDTTIEKAKYGEILKAYGKGWFINNSDYKPYRFLYHPGNNFGVHSLMAYIPEKKIGIVILTNQQPNMVPEILFKRFFDLYLGKYPLKDWNKIYLEEREEIRKSSNKIEEPSNCHKFKYKI